MKGWFTALLALIIVIAPSAASARIGAKAVAKEGFAFPKDKPLSIVVLRPDVQVGSLTTGGLDEANAEWTAKARELIADALQHSPRAGGAKFSFLVEPQDEAGAYVADYRALFRAVSDAIVTHKLFPGNRLPTKKAKFDWTLGTGAAHLREIGGGDYALFFATHDAYGTAGRKVAQFLAAGLLGVYVPAGVHMGYAGLVDLSNGEVVWFNADVQMGGDVRTSDGAQKRVDELLNGFPTDNPPVAKQTTAK